MGNKRFSWYTSFYQNWDHIDVRLLENSQSCSRIEFFFFSSFCSLSKWSYNGNEYLVMRLESAHQLKGTKDIQLEDQRTNLAHLSFCVCVFL